MPAPQTPSTSAPLVVYIGGDARCGSTLLDLMLGALPGFFAVGELSYLWERGLLKNELCGCGHPFRDCPFWQRVGEEAFGGWGNVDAREVMSLERQVTRLRQWPLLFFRRLQRRSFADASAEYARLMERVYLAVAEVSGCPIIVDSSKTPSLGLLLVRMSRTRSRLVHMVRDSRGVAFSWTKRMVRPGPVPSHMPTYPPWYSSIVWTIRNLQYSLMKARGISQLFLRYESLVRTPRRELERILDYIGTALPASDLAFLEHHTLTLEPNHTVSGNPMRFRQGRLVLRLDDEWRTALSLRHRILVTAMTAPVLMLYGYFPLG